MGETENAMADTDRRPTPPYVPWRTFESYIEGLKGFGDSLPNVIDRDSMRTLSGATQSWLLSGLRALNMIDENGAPKPRLNQIVKADADERKTLYKQLISAEYKFLDGINLAGATPRQLDTAFESTGATGDTVRKCIAFFIGLAKAADVPLSSLIQKGRRRPARTNGNSRPARRFTPSPPPPTAKDSDKPKDQDTGSKPAFQVLYELLDPKVMNAEEQAAVWTLLQFIKKGGT